MSDGDDEDERDPFGRLEETAGDREGDPFEALADSDAASETQDAPAPDAASESASSAPDESASAPGPERQETDATGDPTFSPGDPALDAGEPAVDESDPFESPDSFLTHVDVGDVTEDEVWEAISDAQARGSVAEAGERTYAEVSKHSFCEACEYFTGPPTVDCTHEEAEIMEFLDMETVRLVDCPVVAERRTLQQEGTGGS